MIYADVCAGISAATVAWSPLGWKTAFYAEIEPFPCSVLMHHYPDTPNLGDMTRFEEWPDFKLDVLAGGTPCQGFSVAGLRKGLLDDRSNLALTFLLILKRFKPRYVVWENVPGVLSTEDGNDFRQFLDGLEELRYVVDVDILDAQFSGLAQRRRRVFVCGQSADDILNQRTPTSALTILQCVAEISLLILAVHSERSATDSGNWGFDASEPKNSLRRRMRLFDLHRSEAASMLAASLAVILPSSGCEQSVSGSDRGRNSEGDSRTATVTRSSGLNGETEAWRAEFPSTEPSWNVLLEDLLRIAKECITSTPKSGTIDQRIYTCSQVILSITALITPSLNWSPSFWSAVSSTSIALREFTDYARSASSDLFTDVEWVRPWGDFVGQAERASASLGRIGIRNFAREIFPFSEGLRGDPPPSREARKGVAGTLAGGARGSGGYSHDDIPLVAGAVRTGGRGVDDAAHPQTQCVAFKAAHFTRDKDGAPSDLAPPLSAGKGDSAQLVTGGGWAVRRLSPRECERLMGFPDDYSLIPGQGGWRDLGDDEDPEELLVLGFKVKRTKNGKLRVNDPDGPRYRALGNSIATTVLKWIGERIELCDTLLQTDEIRQFHAEEARKRQAQETDERLHAR